MRFGGPVETRTEDAVLRRDWYLKVEAVAPEEPVAPTPMQELATTLETISGACRRGRRRVREGVFARKPSDTKTVHLSEREACLAFDGLAEAVAKVAADA